ncbi:class I SAM-dependent methyltransferase [Thermogemmatispora carboxidivorans]|uniref:class I SAM-dependent methyltransferase n=1 Tax=Thermogemmatispora carboxidivorans TaxID=1382306 RepID=UPI00069AE0BD|nr:class I SAM-dependent methyltransferase [Thermogemmatispora carboxidivorans]
MSAAEEPTAPSQPASEGGTYFIDAEEAAELARLMQQDRLVTEAMGGLLPEVETLPATAQVLDLACGPGGWALELAFHYPEAEVIGVDLSPSIVEYANAQARSRNLSNAHFAVMNITQPLAFSDASFDLINARFLAGFMRPQDWPRLLAECRRLLKPGGLLRLTESEWGLTTSPATQRYYALCSEALKRAGQSFSPDGHLLGITPVLAPLLRQAGFNEVRLRGGVLEWSSGTPYHYSTFKNISVMFDLLKPFLVKTGVARAEEVNALYQQAVAEMQADDFFAVWFWVTAWGRQP